MRILQISPEGLPDFRASKLSRILAEAGYTVDLLTFGGKSESWELGEVFDVPPSSLAAKIHRRLSRYLRPTDFDRRFRGFRTYHEILRNRRYDAVQWKDLLGAAGGAHIAQSEGVPFVLDLHENYPYNIWSSRRDASLRGRYLDLNAWFDYERDAVHQADMVLATCDQMGQRVVGMHGIDSERIRTIHNTEPLDSWPQLPRPTPLKDRVRGRYTILYVGSCSHHRGLDVVIRALPLVQRQVPHARLVIVGSGGGIPDWKRLTDRLGVSEDVHFEGRQPIEKVIDYYASAHVAVIPHHKYGQTDNTLPHKLYQAFVMGIPQLVSSCHSLQVVADQSGAVAVFAAGNPNDAAQKLIDLANDDVREDLGRRGRMAAESGAFSWSAAKSDLTEIYENLVSRSG